MLKKTNLVILYFDPVHPQIIEEMVVFSIVISPCVDGVNTVFPHLIFAFQQ